MNNCWKEEVEKLENRIGFENPITVFTNILLESLLENKKNKEAKRKSLKYLLHQTCKGVEGAQPYIRYKNSTGFQAAKRQLDKMGWDYHFTIAEGEYGNEYIVFLF